MINTLFFLFFFSIPCFGEALFIKTQNNTYEFNIEKAVTPQEQALGLMFRKKLDKNSGMLFLFSEERKRFFWMKNTFLPLDIIFFDKLGKITTIIQNTTPLSEKALSSQIPISGALELNAFTTKELNISIGDSIIF